MSATATQLANNARCIDCYIPQGMQLAVVIYLLQKIAEGGALGSLINGHGDPNGVVSSGTPRAYWDLDAHQLYIKEIDGGNLGWYAY